MKKLTQLLAELRVDGKVDVVKVALGLGIQVKPIKEISNLLRNAFIKKENDDFSIYVNGSQSKQRQRFSIAHEIAHFCLHYDKLLEMRVIDREGEASLSPAQERAADMFAAKMLMPEEDIRAYLDSQGVTVDQVIGKDTVEKLCERYDVSFYAMIVRLRELDYYVPFINVYG